MTLGQLIKDARARQLDVFGALHDGDDTIILLGPFEPGFWVGFSESSEYLDGKPDPLDRWSKTVASGLALDWGGKAIFPSDGPPFAPFFDWALGSGRAWKSPVTLLVHDTAGLWISYRAAIKLAGKIPLPQHQLSPCIDCSAPCKTACPVDALNGETYDVASCKSHLDGQDLAECMTLGCAARRACPVSQSYGRLAAQSEFHMKAFNPK